MTAATSITDLPRGQWRFERCGDDHVVVSTRIRNGYRDWVRFAVSELPNDIVSRDDLKRLKIQLNPTQQ